MATKLNQSHSLKQSQGLSMTPQLQQAIKLLTLTHTEVSSLIAEEMVENPMLEESGEGQDKKKEEVKSETDYRLERLEGDAAEARSQDFSEQVEMGKGDDFDFEKYLESYNAHSSSRVPSMVGPRDSEEEFNCDEVVSRGDSLSEYLEWQLRMVENLSERQWEVAELLIYSLNDSGYLEISLEEVCEETGGSQEEVLSILHMIQGLDPVGCGTRSLQECLLVQAKKMESRIPLLERIIEDYLDLVEKKDWDEIARRMGVESERVRDAKGAILGLNPKPGRLVSPESTEYVVPDIFVRNVGGEFKVEVNNDGVPLLRVSQFYKKI